MLFFVSSVIEGHPTFKLRIKDEAIELRTKRPIDRTNLNKAVRPSSCSILPAISLVYLLLSRRFSRRLSASERPSAPNPGQPFTRRFAVHNPDVPCSPCCLYFSYIVRTSSMSIGSGLGLLGDLSESDEWVKPTKKKDDHSESKSLTSKLLQDCPELYGTPCDRMLRSDIVSNSIWLCRKEKFETYHEEAVWATALEIYDRVVKMKLSPHSLVLTSHRIIIVDNKNKVFMVG